jgi:hypothetical protein
MTGRRAATEERPVVVLPGIDLSNRALFSRGTKKRRSVPIMGYDGTNGSGKTRAMISDSLPSLAMGRKVYSTVELLDPHTGNPHPLYVPFESWSQLHTIQDADLCLDEVTGVMDSRDSGMPKHVRRLLPQMRRRGTPVRWTGIHWDNADVRLRQVTQGLTRCQGYWQNHKLRRASGAVDYIELWAPNQLFSMITYDAKMMHRSDAANAANQQQPKRQQRVKRPKVLVREWLWGPSSLSFKCYNTLDSVLAVDNICTVCKKKAKPEEVCKGHADDELVINMDEPGDWSWPGTARLTTEFSPLGEH